MAKQYDTSRYVERPSEKEGRTYIQRAQTNLTASTDIYTVTPGKTLYITNLFLSTINTSTTSASRIEVVDGGDSGELVASMILPVSIALALSPYETTDNVYEEPYRFQNKVRVVEAIGTATFSISFNGYEE